MKQSIELTHAKLWRLRQNPESDYLKLIKLLTPIFGEPQRLMDFNVDKHFYLRHDVDWDIINAGLMAVFEFTEGIKSSYYFLHTADYFGENIEFSRKMGVFPKLSQEVGLHNNVIGASYNVQFAKCQILTMALNLLGTAGVKILGTSSHGDPLCYEHKFWNYDIFGIKVKNKEIKGMGYDSVLKDREPSTIEPLNMADFGLQYEAYGLMIDNDFDYYVSDSAGKFQITAMWRDFHQKDMNIKEVMEFFRKEPKIKGFSAKNRKIQLLVHPEYYDFGG